jgi:hypothetical protein
MSEPGRRSSLSLGAGAVLLVWLAFAWTMAVSAEFSGFWLVFAIAYTAAVVFVYARVLVEARQDDSPATPPPHMDERAAGGRRSLPSRAALLLDAAILVFIWVWAAVQGLLFVWLGCAIVVTAVITLPIARDILRPKGGGVSS